MLQDIEPQIVDNHLFIKFIFSPNTNIEAIRHTTKSFTESPFAERLKQDFNVAIITCFRDRKDIIVKFEDETEETEQEVIDRFKEAMKVVIED